MRVIHEIAPVFDKRSRFLILGTMPSPRSREQGFFYGHPQNRFWKILAAVYGADPGETIAAKKDFLLERRLALWDVLAECDIEGASDSSIKNPVPNDFSLIFNKARIEKIFCTGRRSFSLYEKLCAPKYDIPYFALPSPSPANCALSFADICAAYKSAILFL